jgi:DNA-binding MarR family transcriptional regulator
LAFAPLFVLTNNRWTPYLRRMPTGTASGATAVRRTAQVVQVAFPQIYLACHTRHQRKRSTAHRLSERDSSILAHLDERYPITPARLASHLGVARSTLSEALKRLASLGYVATPAGSNGHRRSQLVLSALGAAAIRDTSVLETERLEAALETATPGELRQIRVGLATLAEACRRRSDGARRTRGVAR